MMKQDHYTGQELAHGGQEKRQVEEQAQMVNEGWKQYFCPPKTKRCSCYSRPNKTATIGCGGDDLLAGKL